MVLGVLGVGDGRLWELIRLSSGEGREGGAGGGGFMGTGGFRGDSWVQ